MKPEINNSAYYPEQQGTADLKNFLSQIARNWYWFVLSIFFGISVAWAYNRYMPPEYSIHSSLLINQYESGIKRLSLSQNSTNDRNIDIISQDHAGRLKSHLINFNTLQSLGWNISWYQKNILFSKDLYNQEPYTLSLLSDKKNLTEVPVQITEISSTEYQVDYELVRANQNSPQSFSQKGIFGKPFINNNFSFILDKSPGQYIKVKNLYFVVHNLDYLALKYQKKIKVFSNDKKPDLMEVLISENNPQRGVDFLNRLEQTYIEFGLAEKTRVAENTIRYIDNQLESFTGILANSEDKITNYRTDNKAVNLNQESGFAMQKQQTLESDKALLEYRLEYLRNLRQNMKDSRQLKQIMVPSVFGISDQTLNNLVAKLSELYSRREVLSFSFEEKAPSLILLNKELQLTINLLNQTINTLLTTTEMDLKNVIRRTSGIRNRLTLLPKTEQQLSSLKQSFDLNNEVYIYLLKMRAESAISCASNQPDLKVLDPASVETAIQIRPMTTINYLIGIVFGLLIPLITISFKRLINNSIQTYEEIGKLTNLPIAGMIIHNKSRKDLAVFDNPRSNVAESFRLLRTNLKYVIGETGKKVIAVQSTISGEGKSFISMNLASILAINNLKVLLVGVDMHMSILHKAMKSDNNKGLSTYLSNQDNFEDIIETTPIPNLSYISSGPTPLNPAELLENGNFDRFMREAKSRFDYIILDSPPVALVTDGILTGRLADINLFVLRFRFSTTEQIKYINEHDIKKTFPNIALVLNDALRDNYGYRYHYNKRYTQYF